MPAEFRLNDGETRIPVGKIVCLGRNYAAHAKEMGLSVPSEPILFLKPASSIIQDGEDIVIPEDVGEVHHEVELGVVIGERCRKVPLKEALDKVLWYVVLIDVTARELQAAARARGMPWTLAKGMDTFCPISAVTPREAVPDPGNLAIRLMVNGEVRQNANSADMIWGVADIIECISARITLERGDLIATGTPEGVSAIVPGDQIEATIDGIGTLRCGVK